MDYPQFLVETLPNKTKGKRPCFNGNGSQRAPNEISPNPAVSESLAISDLATRGTVAESVRLSKTPY